MAALNPGQRSLARGRRASLLIVGCGDIGLRVLRLLRGRMHVYALTTAADRVPALRAAGAVPLVGDLDRPATLGRLGELAERVLHLAPPPGQGEGDPRTAALLRALARGARVQRLVYASTTGVYGDCGGARVDETRAVAPATARARRRVDAEARVRHFGRSSGACVTILRVPGIYAPGRAGGDPRERVLRGAPALRREDDVHTNHVHADDLARACVAALFRGRPQRVLNACDDTELAMGDYLDLVADHHRLPRPPRLTRAQAREVLSETAYSFLTESRRLSNTRLKRELKLALLHPTVAHGIGAAG
jgi:nucleoside-diphosphate-sugar epimerase